MLTAIGVVLALVGIGYAMFAVYLFLKLTPGQRMTLQEARSYKGSIARAEAEYQRQKTLHDLTGDHTWLDITTHGDAQRKLMCAYCNLIRVESYPCRTQENPFDV